MNSQIKSFVEALRQDHDFTVKYRERDGKHTFTGSYYSKPLNDDQLDDLQSEALNHGLQVEVRGDSATHTNFRATATSKPKTATNLPSNFPAKRPPERLPDYQYAVIKSIKAGERAATRLQSVIDSGRVHGAELDLLEEQLSAQENLNIVLKNRVNFYNIAAYL